MRQTLWACCMLFVLLSPSLTQAQPRFTDDFEGGLSGWTLLERRAFEIIDSGDPAHRNVLKLSADNRVVALVTDSDKWGAVRIEGDVLFPDDEHNYLGLIYNYTETDVRTDFGSVYIKGNGSYIRMNPHRDGDVGRVLYEEFKTPLVGDDAIIIGEWKHFKAEVMQDMIHFYVGDMTKPKVTFGFSGMTSGLVGFSPRLVGYPTWLDNIEITSISQLSYAGPALPQIDYEPEELHTDWQVIGPLTEPSLAVERSEADQEFVLIDGERHFWRAAPVDPRGAVITSAVTEFLGPGNVAYFRTVLHSEKAQEIEAHFSSTDDFGIWLNTRFDDYNGDNSDRPANPMATDHSAAWYDFWNNPEHQGERWSFPLQPGDNHFVLRIRTGRWATGGFFARFEDLAGGGRIR